MKKVRKVILVLVGVIVVFFLMIAIAMGVKMREMQKNMEAVENVPIDMSEVKDGSYMADTDLGLVKVKVEVTVENHQISTIEILEHQNGKGKPAEAIVDEMIEKNTDEVDAVSGPVIKDKKAYIDHEKCVGCGRCLAVCPKDAISGGNDNSVKLLNYKMAEYSLAVCQNRPCFHISLICDVSPNCDCHSENDIPIIPNIGMLASFDPVALDRACVDLCNKMAPVKESILGENLETHTEDTNHEHFHMTHPDAEWESCLAHAIKIGLGTDQYELITI